MTVHCNIVRHLIERGRLFLSYSWQGACMVALNRFAPKCQTPVPMNMKHLEEYEGTNVLLKVNIESKYSSDVVVLSSLTTI